MQNNPYAAPKADPTTFETGTPRGAIRDWNPSDVLSVGWETVKKEPLLLIGGGLMVQILPQIPSQLVAGIAANNPDIGLILSVIMFPITMFLSVLLNIGMWRVALALLRNQPADFGMFFNGVDRVLPGFLAGLLVGLGVLLGMLLLIVPGVILGLGWSFSTILNADTKLGPVALLAESWEATKGHKGNIFLFGLLAFLVLMLGVLACVVGVFVAMPVVLVAFAEIYIRVTGRTSPAVS